MILFHVSFQNLHQVTLTPRLPQHYLTDRQFENQDIPRICVSTSVEGCLMGLAQNLEGKMLFVHRCQYSDQDLMGNAEVQQHVPDAHLTRECWILNPVKMKLLYSIKVGSAIDPGLPYWLPNGEKVELYRWHYQRC